jgi:hypothetical protein
MNNYCKMVFSNNVSEEIDSGAAHHQTEHQGPDQKAHLVKTQLQVKIEPSITLNIDFGFFVHEGHPQIEH